MSERSKEEIIKHAQDGGLRRALVVTALALETRAVRAHLTHLGSVGSRDGTVYECGEGAHQREQQPEEGDEDPEADRVGSVVDLRPDPEPRRGQRTPEQQVDR